MRYPVLVVAVLLTPVGEAEVMMDFERDESYETEALCVWKTTGDTAMAAMANAVPPKSIEVTCEKREAA